MTDSLAGTGRRLGAGVAGRCFLALTLLTAAAENIARAHDHSGPGIEIIGPRAPALEGGGSVQMVYLTIRNRTALPDRLTAVRSSAGTVELHGAPGEGGRPAPFRALPIGPGESLVLDADGPHLALTGLSRPLAEEESFRLALEFEQAGRIVVRVTVGKAGPGGAHRH